MNTEKTAIIILSHGINKLENDVTSAMLICIAITSNNEIGKEYTNDFIPKNMHSNLSILLNPFWRQTHTSKH